MGSTFFGEILEPSSRALINDEFDYPQNEQIILEVESQLALPEQINILLFIETKNTAEGHFYGLCDSYKSDYKNTKVGIEILYHEKYNYVIKWSPTKCITSGEVVQLFQKWINLAAHVYSITMLSIGTYQNYEIEEKPSSIIRILTNDKNSWPYKKLEPPNLISDFTSNILSYCIHCNIKCSLFIIYTDLLPCDSLNTGPLAEVLNQINLPFCKLYKVKPVMSSGNLYV